MEKIRDLLDGKLQMDRKRDRCMAHAMALTGSFWPVSAVQGLQIVEEVLYTIRCLTSFSRLLARLCST